MLFFFFFPFPSFLKIQLQVAEAGKTDASGEASRRGRGHAASLSCTEGRDADCQRRWGHAEVKKEGKGVREEERAENKGQGKIQRLFNFSRRLLSLCHSFQYPSSFAFCL